MDIGIDQARPWAINNNGVKYRDLIRFASGKYLYRMNNGEIEIDRFNRDFDQYKWKRKGTMDENLKLLNLRPRPLSQEIKASVLSSTSTPTPTPTPSTQEKFMIEPLDGISNNSKYLWIIFAMFICIFIIIVFFH